MKLVGRIVVGGLVITGTALAAFAVGIVLGSDIAYEKMWNQIIEKAENVEVMEEES